LISSPMILSRSSSSSRGRAASITAGANATAALHSAAETSDTAPDEGEGDEGADDDGCYYRPFAIGFAHTCIPGTKRVFDAVNGRRHVGRKLSE